MPEPAEPAAAPTMAEMEARIAAMSALMKSLLTILVLRGLLTRAEIAPLVADAEKLMGTSAASAMNELRSIEAELPGYMREAMGPPPDDDDHDH